MKKSLNSLLSLILFCGICFTCHFLGAKNNTLDEITPELREGIEFIDLPDTDIRKMPSPTVKQFDKNNIPQHHIALYVDNFKLLARHHLKDSMVFFLEIEGEDPPEIVMAQFKDSPLFQRKSASIHNSEDGGYYEKESPKRRGARLSIGKIRIINNNYVILNHSKSVGHLYASGSLDVKCSYSKGKWFIDCYSNIWAS